MSTWFKFYPRDLNSPRFQYCQKKQPSVVGIYLWCLCCCAEEGSDSFPWLNTAVEFDGLASTLHISYEESQSGIGLLIDAKLIALDKVGIKVVGWQEHQSDYMGRRAYFSKRYRNYTVKHSEARLEESREDQSTEESELPEPNDVRPSHMSKMMKKATHGTNHPRTSSDD